MINKFSFEDAMNGAHITTKGGSAHAFYIDGEHDLKIFKNEGENITKIKEIVDEK